jgi:hypothetical protein
MELVAVDMPRGSVTINDDNVEKNRSMVTYHGRFAYGKSTAYDTWSIVVHVRQLQTDIHARYQHEKNELTELNQRFSLIVDRVRQLELLNSKYVAQIMDFRQKSFGMSRIGTHAQRSEQYLHLQSDLRTISFAKVDCEVDVELLQLQSGMYQQLIDDEQQWQGRDRLKLEQELNRSASTLVTLRASYAKLGQEIECLYATRGDTFKQYLEVTHSWCHAKKQRKQSDLSLQTMKQHTVFYKNISSYCERWV